MKRYALLTSLGVAMILAGCGGGSSSDTDTAATTSTTGYFVDAPVANLNYDCIADGTGGVTDANGAFTCQNRTRVRFRVGELILGEIDTLPADGYVFPQDLAGVARENVTDPRVTAMAQLLQSLDTDGDPTNGITLAPDETTVLPAGTFDPQQVQLYLDAASVPPMRIRTATQAQEHLRQTLQLMNNTPINTQPSPATTELPEEVKDAIRYMDNEERLAYDLYSSLYSYHAANGVELFQLNNIAQSSEIQHIATVEMLAEKYGIETASDLPTGVYSIPEVQTLYDTLYPKGTQSPQDAMEVGCMVEVTDINDLTHDIATAQAAGASDIVSAFESLRSASYTHYWSFDAGLKSMGVAEGCCSLGNEYCHPEYPQTDKGNPAPRTR